MSVEMISPAAGARSVAARPARVRPRATAPDGRAVRPVADVLPDGTPCYAPVGEVIVTGALVTCHLCGRSLRSVTAHLRVHGWTKLEYRQGDVRDPHVLRETFEGADAVVHLAFMITGTASRETIRAINVGGTLNAFGAAAAAGARRFVYASSVAAYGFHEDNPIGMTEDWPTRPASRLFYAQEKAELERLLHEQADAHPEVSPRQVLDGSDARAAADALELTADETRWFSGEMERPPVPRTNLVLDVSES